jgi:PAS domain S-box-containing protein
MQERLQTSEARLMEAQRLAKVGSWERDIKSGKIHWSDEIFRILGLTSVPENFAAFLSYVHPKDRETILGIDDIVRSSIAPVEVEYRIIRPDGETRFVRSIVKGIRDDHGVLVRITGATQDITERKRLERIAEANRKEVQALAASLMTAQEDERRRVSLELHDGMCQELGSLAIEIGKIAAHLPSPRDVPGQLRALQARVVKASVEARNLAYQLSPPGLDELGLPIVLQDLCNQFAERAPGMALEFTSGALPESVPLKVTSCVYRVAQESLYNTVKHSRAKHASVILTWRQGAIELTIADDGDGFDSQSVQGKGGLGLIGMEERARLVHGKLTIMSHPGSGTRIALDVPLPVPAVLVTDNDR